MTKTEKPIYSPVVIDFITVAAQYCVTLEQTDTATARRPFLECVSRLLPLVYVKATLLPTMEAVGEEELPEAVGEEDYEAVRSAVCTVLGDGDCYLEVFSSEMQYSESPVAASVSELLADIYQDLKNFVAVYAGRNEVAMNNAVARVQETFALYWGQKLVNVMRPVHDLLYGHPDDGGDAAIDGDEEDCHDHGHGCHCHDEACGCHAPAATRRTPDATH